MHTAVARVRSSLGNNVLLRCGTVGVPIPELTWSRADGKKPNGTSEYSSLCWFNYPRHVGIIIDLSLGFAFQFRRRFQRRASSGRF